MNATDQKIADLIAEVETAEQEFDMAMMFHEVWKPASYDRSLHQRIGNSAAANAFLVVRMALRREMLLALMRLWDQPSRSVRMDEVARTLSDETFVDALSTDRAKRAGLPVGLMREELRQRASEIVSLVAKYSHGSSRVRANLKRLRDERLAHRQVREAPKRTDATRAAPKGPDAMEKEIERFYQDTSELVRLLLSVVKGMAYDPQDAAVVYRRYAELFWASVRGERTEGHPAYRPPP